jgi:hypothetical protein
MAGTYEDGFFYCVHLIHVFQDSKNAILVLEIN